MVLSFPHAICFTIGAFKTTPIQKCLLLILSHRSSSSYHHCYSYLSISLNFEKDFHVGRETVGRTRVEKYEKIVFVSFL